MEAGNIRKLEERGLKPALCKKIAFVDIVIAPATC